MTGYRIFVSQRVDCVADYAERRDALDQRLSAFLFETGAICYPLPNQEQTLRTLLQIDRPDGIVLSGGNSPQAYGGTAPERDQTDHLLLDFAQEHRIPLIGICRGMQSIVLHFGGTLRPIEGHIAQDHPLTGSPEHRVNSYHSLAPDRIPEAFDICARAQDGAVECIRHTELPILALMWHPERTSPFSRRDIAWFATLWQQGRRKKA